jgi:hypothetical protein
MGGSSHSFGRRSRIHEMLKEYKAFQGIVSVYRQTFQITVHSHSALAFRRDGASVYHLIRIDSLGMQAMITEPQSFREPSIRRLGDI